jgi:hypothetical protein
MAVATALSGTVTMDLLLILHFLPSQVTKELLLTARSMWLTCLHTMQIYQLRFHPPPPSTPSNLQNAVVLYRVELTAQNGLVVAAAAPPHIHEHFPGHLVATLVCPLRSRI